MKNRFFTSGVGLMLLMGSLALAYPALTVAQEATEEKKTHEGSMGMHSQMGMEKQPEMKKKMQKMHEQMEAMHQEMTEELQKQLTALHEHTQAMEGITDEKQLLTEMKKHQQMTDELLGTMVEQRVKMHARMKERRERMRSRKGKERQAEPQESGGHEAHHGQ